MTHKIQKMLAQNHIEQAKKNRPKAFILTAITLACVLATLVGAIMLEGRHIRYSGLWLLGAMAIWIILLIFTAIAWAKTDPVQLVPRKEVIPIATSIFRYNESTIKRLIGMAVWGKDQEISLLSTVTFKLDDDYPFEPIMEFNLDAPVPNWDIVSLKIYLKANDMVAKVQLQTENNIHYPFPQNAVNKSTIHKDMRIRLPLTAVYYPLEYRELATIQ